MNNLQSRINDLMERLKKEEIKSIEFPDEIDSIITFNSDSDGLSQVSDVSSIDSFDFTETPRKIIQFDKNDISKKNNQKKKNNNPKTSSPKKQRKSKLPIRKGPYSPSKNSNQSNFQNFKSNQRSTAQTPDSSLKKSSNNYKYSSPTLISSAQSNRNPLVKSNTTKITSPINSPSPKNPSEINSSRNINMNVNDSQFAHSPTPRNFAYSNQVVTNLFEPNYSNYKYIFIGFYEGKDYPQSEIGQRNTYIQFIVHPNLPEINTEVVYNCSNNIDYHFGCNLFCEGLNFHFNNFTPVLSVFDLITPEKAELIGKGYPQFQNYHIKNGKCYVYEKEWINLISSARTFRGKVCITIAFHNEDNYQPAFDEIEHQYLDNSINNNKKVIISNNKVKPNKQNESQHIEIINKKPTKGIESTQNNHQLTQNNQQSTQNNQQSIQEETLNLDDLSLSYGNFSNSQLLTSKKTNENQKNILTILNEEDDHDRDHLKFLSTLDLDETADILPTKDDLQIPQWVDSDNGLDDSEPLSTSVTHYIINSPDDPPSPLKEKYLRYKDFGFKTVD